MTVYGRDFAWVYNRSWGGWLRNKAWPFLSKTVTQRVPHAQTWLDLCCGTGWLVEKAHQQGFRAVGLDSSAHQLRHARKNAPKCKFVRDDIRKFNLQTRFDVITCMFDSLNYLTRKNDLLRAFRNVRRHLDPTGCFIFDVNTFEGLQDIWHKTSTSEGPACTLIMSSSFDEKRALGRAVITGFIKQGKVYRKFREEHIERGYRPSEIEDLLSRASFTFQKYDGRDFLRPRKRSPRLVYVCQQDT